MLATCQVQAFYLNNELLPHLLIYSFIHLFIYSSNPLLIDNLQESDRK